MATFGITDAGTASDSGWTTGCRCGIVATLTEAGSITSISALLANTGSGHGATNVKGIIYVSNGQGVLPGARLAVSNATAVSDSQAKGWVECTFAAPVELEADEYIIGYTFDAAGDGLLLYGDGGATATVWYSAPSGDDYTNPADPWGGSNVWAGGGSYGRMCVYATYDVDAPSWSGLTVIRDVSS